MPDEPESTAAEVGNRVAQHNNQTLHVHIHNHPKASSLIANMAGTALREEGAIPLSNCEIQLFFGPIGEHPVATARTDAAGAFAFDDLPPGYYGLRVCLPEGHWIHLHNLRVLPGETCQPRVLLSGRAYPTPTRFGPASEAAFLARGIPMEDLT